VSAGTYRVTTTFPSTSDYNAVTDTSQEVIIDPAATSVSLASSASPSVPGQYVTFTANVTPVVPGSGTPTGTITFKDGSTMLGTVALQNYKATINVPLTTLGTHTITVAYTPTGGNFTAPAQPTSLAQTVQPVALEPAARRGSRCSSSAARPTT
jgi:hypothetical protein